MDQVGRDPAMGRVAVLLRTGGPHVAQGGARLAAQALVGAVVGPEVPRGLAQANPHREHGAAEVIVDAERLLAEAHPAQGSDVVVVPVGVLHAAEPQAPALALDRVHVATLGTIAKGHLNAGRLPVALLQGANQALCGLVDLGVLSALGVQVDLRCHRRTILDFRTFHGPAQLLRA